MVESFAAVERLAVVVVGERSGAVEDSAVKVVTEVSVAEVGSVVGVPVAVPGKFNNVVPVTSSPLPEFVRAAVRKHKIMTKLRYC